MGECEPLAFNSVGVRITVGVFVLQISDSFVTSLTSKDFVLFGLIFVEFGSCAEDGLHGAISSHELIDFIDRNAFAEQGLTNLNADFTEVIGSEIDQRLIFGGLGHG